MAAPLHVHALQLNGYAGTYAEVDVNTTIKVRHTTSAWLVVGTNELGDTTGCSAEHEHHVKLHPGRNKVHRSYYVHCWGWAPWRW